MNETGYYENSWKSILFSNKFSNDSNYYIEIFFYFDEDTLFILFGYKIGRSWNGRKDIGKLLVYILKVCLFAIPNSKIVNTISEW